MVRRWAAGCNPAAQKAGAPGSEVDTHLRLLLGTGAIEASQADSAIQLFDDVSAITWRLLHPAL